MKNARALSRCLLASTLCAGLALAAPALARERRPAPPEDPPDPVPALPAASSPALLSEGLPWTHGGRAWLGVRVAEVEPGSAASPEEVYGARVTAVEEGSPAEHAGLQAEDVILSYQGQRVESARALTRMVRETPPGRTVRLGVRRAGEARTFDVTLEERRPGPHARIHPDIEIPDLPFEDPGELLEAPQARPRRGRLLFDSGPRLGIEAESLDGQLAAYFGVAERGGLLIREVRPGTPAEKAGLRAGDVILKVGGAEVADVEALRDALREAEGGTVALTIVRERSEKSVEVDLRERRRSGDRRGARRPSQPAAAPGAERI